MRSMIKAGVAFAVLFAASAVHAQNNRGTLNYSTAITAGNTFQVIRPAESRWSITIENNIYTNTDNCWLYVGSGSATKANAILLVPGGSYQRYYPYVPSDELQATCASSADTLYVDEQ